MGLFIGLAVSIGALILIGDTLENVLLRTIRNSLAAGQRLLGIDPVTICVNKARSAHRWSAKSFADEATTFNILRHSSLNGRQQILAQGNNILLFERGYGVIDNIYDMALLRHCKKQAQ